jgi:hypothetical protein
MYGTDKYIQNFGWKGRNYSENLGVDGMIQLKWILGKLFGWLETGFV